MITQDDLIAGLNWEDIATQLDQEGYAVVRGLLNDSQVCELAALAGTASTGDRVSLAAEELGRGDLFYFSQRLPALIEDLRTAFYQRLVLIANRWNDVLNIAHRYPDTLDVFLTQNRKAGQKCAQSNLTRLGADDYQALHQLGDAATTLKVGTVSSDLAAMHKAHRVDCRAFITARNPFSQSLDDPANAAREAAFARELKQRSLTFIDGVGLHLSNHWPGEASFLILGLTLEAAKTLGARFAQNAIVWTGADVVPRLILLR